MRTQLLIVVYLLFAATDVFCQCSIDICNLNTCGDVFVSYSPSGANVFCEGSSIILENTSSTPDFGEFQIDWGDGGIETYYTYDDITHEFNYNDSIRCADGPIFNQTFCYIGIKECDDSLSMSCNWAQGVVSVKLKPVARFGLPFQYCSTDSIELFNESCNGETFFWDFGDGTTSTDEFPVHTFTSSGVKTVSLTVTNECGSDSKTRQIEIINPAMINIETIVDPLSGCVPLKVTLTNTTANIDTTDYSTWPWWWDISPAQNGMGTNWDFADSTFGAASWSNCILFYEPNPYEITINVENVCGSVSFTETIEAIEGEALLLNEQADECGSIDYTPSPFSPNATYIIDGVVVSTFPISLGIGSHVVQAELDNICGDQLKMDSFDLIEPFDVSISLPLGDTVVCVGSEPVLLEFTPDGGTWIGSNLIQMNDSVWFNPLLVGDYQLTYSKGLGACADSEIITITVEGVDVVINDYDVCSWSAPFLLTANVPGGNWSCPDCPSCIQNDNFIVANMVATGLDIVSINYNVTSTIGCDGNNSATVTIHHPLAEFSIPDTACLNTPVSVTNTSIGIPVLWRVNGSPTPSPPFLNLSAGLNEIELVVETPGACRDSTIQNVFVVVPPQSLSFNMDTDEGCADLTVTFTNPSLESGVGYLWDFGNGEFSNASNPPPVTYQQGISDTTYIITLSVGNGCGDLSFTDTVLVHPQPISNFGTDFNSYCSGDTVYLANTSWGDPDQCIFDFGNGSVITDCDFGSEIYFTGDIPTTVTLTLITENECGIDTLTKDIIINPTDVTAFFNTNPTTVCEGDTVFFNSFATPGADLVWTFGDGNQSTHPNPFHVYQSSDTFEVVQYAYGCGFDSTTVMVTVQPTPDVDFSSNEIVCFGDTLFFTNLSENIVVNSDWDFGDNQLGVNQTNPYYVYDAPGTYTVTLTGTTIDGCFDTAIGEVMVIEPPTALMQIPDSVCVGELVTFTNVSPGNISSCLWLFGDGESSGDCVATYNYDNGGNYTVSLIITDLQAGCKDTVSQLIYVRPVPEAGFVFVLNDICTPATATFTNNSVDANGYLWEFGDGSTSTLENPVHTYMTGDVYTVELTAFFDGICTHTISQPLVINQTPTAAFGPVDTTGCGVFELSYDNQSIGDNLTYAWDFSSGVSGTSFEENPGVVFETPGNYIVSLIVDTEFCQDTAYGTVEVFEPVTANITSTNILCNGAATGSINVVTTGGTPNFEYDWSNGSIFPNQNDLPAGAYELTIEDSNGCTFSENIVLIQPTAITYDLVEEGIVSCFGGTDGFLGIIADGGVPGYQYQWSTGSTNTMISNLSAGTYFGTITDSNSCTSVYEIELGQNELLEILPQVIHISCFGFDDGQILIDSIFGGVAPYEVNLTGANYDETGTGFTFLTLGIYNATIIDSLDCMVEVDLEVIEPAPVDIDIEEDSLIIRLGEEVPIKTNFNANNPFFAWSPNHRLDCTDCPVPTAQPFHDITYQVTMTDENGCVDTDSIFMQIIAERVVFIPDAFTPNFDGNNDVFHVLTGDPSVKVVKVLRVLDRWGELLFETEDILPNDQDLGWDGTFRGKRLDPGVFAYYAEVEFVDGVILIYSGDLTLIR